MWIFFFILSIASLVFSGVLSDAVNLIRGRSRRQVSVLRMMLVGVFLASFFAFYPVHRVTSDSGPVRPVLLSIFNAMQVFTIGAEFSLISDAMGHCPAWLVPLYQIWASVLYVLAPIMTFGFVLSLFENINASIHYLSVYFKDVYIFSELNDKTLALAGDIQAHHPKAAIAFAHMQREDEENAYELTEQAKQLGAIHFKKDILTPALGTHYAGSSMYFFAMGEKEGENVDQAIGLIERYRGRDKTHVYVFSTQAASALLLSAVDKGAVKVRRVNSVQSLINRILYEHGTEIFDHAAEGPEGIRQINAVVVGMGNHGTEMVKALAWYGQMDGYRITVEAFDKDPLAEEKFRALAPELMSEKYNGTQLPGETRYTVRIHPKQDVQTAAFAQAIRELKKTTYVFVSLGDDDRSITAATQLRMLFEREGCHPVIQAVVTNSQQKKALEGIRNFRGQAYDIDFMGDVASSYTEAVILDSELEEEALARHLKWGREEDFWAYEYNYRSSVATAIHRRARIHCGIPGAHKAEEELTGEEKLGLEILEHRRWNAYMRAEGYIFSGSTDKASRNDLAKMHHDLVAYQRLTEEEKRKDSKVATN